MRILLAAAALAAVSAAHAQDLPPAFQETAQLLVDRAAVIGAIDRIMSEHAGELPSKHVLS